MYIRVRVSAGAKKESFAQSEKDSFWVSVKEHAEQNLANKRVLEIIALHFGISPKQIRIISGHHAPGKILSIHDKKCTPQLSGYRG
ncbi:MAG: DUF167 domain-containing protein [Candidatus Yonathbacteria bacterium]|nr:DUF167 domain-containing protein [Candidatus Yonathbacteria bacterium]